MISGSAYPFPNYRLPTTPVLNLSGSRNDCQPGVAEVGIEGKHLRNAQVLYHREVHTIGKRPLRVIILYEHAPRAVKDHRIRHEKPHKLRVPYKLIYRLSRL